MYRAEQSTLAFLLLNSDFHNRATLSSSIWTKQKILGANKARERANMRWQPIS
ncbi:hypothetical protein SAMN05216262_106108 [Colwellia chukchiensis]|uniref:Uncharacterized protein n=1 Tax=Colwellia chukchiensis TaxID=641665 RepID=A0A1H7MTB7_9GAMM|nr:hypothetical protein SAMN05216262_106108 [Colwellia chukchiensis]